jgi:hypothetical protein
VGIAAAPYAVPYAYVDSQARRVRALGGLWPTSMVDPGEVTPCYCCCCCLYAPCPSYALVEQLEAACLCLTATCTAETHVVHAATKSNIVDLIYQVHFSNALFWCCCCCCCCCLYASWPPSPPQMLLLNS